MIIQRNVRTYKLLCSMVFGLLGWAVPNTMNAKQIKLCSIVRIEWFRGHRVIEVVGRGCMRLAWVHYTTYSLVQAIVGF